MLSDSILEWHSSHFVILLFSGLFIGMEIALLVVAILQLIVAVIGLVDLKTFDKIKKKPPP